MPSFLAVSLSLHAKTLFRSRGKAAVNAATQFFLVVWWVAICLAAVGAGLQYEPVAQAAGANPLALLREWFISVVLGVAILNAFVRGPEGRFNAHTFLLLPVSRRDVARLVAAMSQARSVLAALLLLIASIWLGSRPFPFLVLISALALPLSVHLLLTVTRVRLVGRLQFVHGAIIVVLFLLMPSGAAEILSIGYWRFIESAPIPSAAVHLLLVAFLFRSVVLAFANRLYLEETSTAPTGRASPTKIASGDLVHQLRTELLLIVRNRRPAQTVTGLVPALILFGITLNNGDRDLFPVAFVSFLGTGGVVVGYGLLQFSWEGRWFDGILARPGFPSEVAARKLRFHVAASAASTLFLLPGAVYLGITVPWLALFAYSAGVAAPLVLLQATFNRVSVDLSRSSVLNYQGVTLRQSLFTLVVLMIPVAVVLVVGRKYGWALIATLGLLGLAALPLWKRALEMRLQRVRYAMSEGFRRV